MSKAFDVSVPDKDRPKDLISDGNFHYLGIIPPGKTKNQRSFAPVTPGEQDVAIELFGDTHYGAGMWLRFQRYPSMDSTAWEWHPFPPGTGMWGFTHAFPFVVPAGISVGVDYMLPRGIKANVKHRVFKMDYRG